MGVLVIFFFFLTKHEAILGVLILWSLTQQVGPELLTLQSL